MSHILSSVGGHIIILTPLRRFLPLIIIKTLCSNSRHHKSFHDRHAIFVFYFLFEFYQLFFYFRVYIPLFLRVKWPTSKGDVVSLGGSLFRHLKLTHSGLVTTVKVVRLSDPMIAATALAVFFIHRLFHEGKALWVG